RSSNLDEIIAMIVTRLHPDRRFLSGALARLCQQFGLELLGEEIVGVTLVDEEVGEPRAGRDQRTGIIGAPRLAIFAQIARQRLLAPRTLRRRDDRGEGRDRAEAVGRA